MEGWDTAPLGNLCNLASGGTPASGVAEYYEDGEIRWLVSGDVHRKEIWDCDKRITALGLSNSSAKLLPKDSVLMAINGQGKTRGTVAILRVSATCNQSIVCMTPKDRSRISADYLFYYLDGMYQQLRDITGDKDRRGLNMPLLRQIDVRFPSLAEQARIVSVVKEVSAAIAIATANAEKNLANTLNIFDTCLESVFGSRGADWVALRQPLSSLCLLVVDCEHKTARTQEDGIPSVRTPNIGKGILLLEGVYRVSEETYCEWTRRAEPMPGDLVLAREAPAGNVAVIPQGMRLCLGQRTVLIRPRKDIFEPMFLAYLLLCPETQARLLAHSRGATVEHVNMKDIRALDVGAIPPVDVQRGIVERLNTVAEESGRLAGLHRRKLDALDALKKSLLDQAFSGNL